MIWTAQELSEVASSGLKNVILRILSLQWKPLSYREQELRRADPIAYCGPNSVITC